MTPNSTDRSIDRPIDRPTDDSPGIACIPGIPGISPARLRALQAGHAPLMVFDCSYDLSQPAWGEQQFRALHVAGATYADLDRDLSAMHGAPDAHGRVIVGARQGKVVARGRFPLPERERFALWLCSVGFRHDMQAVVYDRNGERISPRLAWMLRWAGHAAVAVLDGGLDAWLQAGGPTRGTAPGADDHDTEPRHFQSEFELRPPLPPADLGLPPLAED